MTNTDLKNYRFFENLVQFFRFITKVIFSSILVFLLLLFITFIIYMGDIFFNTITGHPKAPLFSTYVIVSPSMIPTIKINDAIVVKRNDHDNYKIGDIITFLSNDSNYQGYTITHRIVEKSKIATDKSIYTTKGDNNPIADPSVITTDSIYGKVLFTIPSVGTLKNYFSKPSNYFLCLIVTSVIFIIYELVRIMSSLFKEEELEI